MPNDPYYILGVPHSATREEIKKAFHKLAHQHHPDKGGNAEVFKKITWAYSELSKVVEEHRPASPYDNPYRRGANVDYIVVDEAGDLGSFWQAYGSSNTFQEMMMKAAEAVARQYAEQQAHQQEAMRNQRGPINPNEYRV